MVDLPGCCEEDYLYGAISNGKSGVDWRVAIGGKLSRSEHGAYIQAVIFEPVTLRTWRF